MDDATGDFYIEDDFGNRVIEDYHHLQQSPNSTHLAAAKEMGEAGESTTAGGFQGSTAPEEMGRQWQQTVAQLKPAILKSGKSELIAEEE